MTSEPEFGFSAGDWVAYRCSGCGDRWDLEVSSGILIKLPDSEIKNALDLCFEILNDDKFKNVKIIDLRQTKRLITNE